MKQITLDIKALDIIDTEYSDSTDCAITRALNRAGLNYEDAGMDIVNSSGEDVSINKDEHRALTLKVMGMYSTKEGRDFNHNDDYGNSSIVPKLEIEDFVHTITFYDLE